LFSIFPIRLGMRHPFRKWRALAVSGLVEEAVSLVRSITDPHRRAESDFVGETGHSASARPTPSPPI